VAQHGFAQFQKARRPSINEGRKPEIRGSSPRGPATKLGIDQPTASGHLQVLERAGLVTYKKIGPVRMFRLTAKACANATLYSSSDVLWNILES